MNPSPKTITFAAIFAALLALPALAQDRPAFFGGHRHGGGILHCLRSADLTDAQKADVKALFEAARPGFQADIAAIRAAHKTLRSDADAGADKSVLGQDYLNARAATQKLRDDHAALGNQILGKLTADQKTKVQSCLDSLGSKMGAHAGAEF